MKYEKLASPLLTAYEDFRSSGEPALRMRSRAMGMISAEGRPRPARVVVFLHCDEEKDFTALTPQGLQVNQRRGRIRTAILPLESLDALSEDDGVHRIVPARYLKPRMDVALPKMHIPEFRGMSLTGQGVILGVVDTGIDTSHPAFAGRILKIWDQTLSGAGVPEGGYGAELAGSTFAMTRDTHGHGTHVGGIAGGSDPKYGGIAPRADYVVVKTDFMNAHIADGIRYIFRVARELNRPAVVNLSLGGHGDAHDGTDSLSQIIDQEAGAGRIVCCAAGNEGNDNIHAQSIVGGGHMRRMRFLVPDMSVTLAALNGWYPGSATLEVSVRSPGGFVTPYQPVITFGSPVRSYTLPDGGVTIATPGPDPDNGDHNFWIEIKGETDGHPVAGGIWLLRVRNNTTQGAELHVWTLDDEGGRVVFTGTSVKDSVKIGSPGSASSAITVAAYTTKVEWTDVNGADHSVGFELDDITDFSSEGPLRNGARKPDVAAPGAMIASTLSTQSAPTAAWILDVRNRVNAGTSMACPFIAGLTALLLQRDPKLDPTGVKALLSPHSRIPGKASGSFHPKWGFGVIDATNL